MRLLKWVGAKQRLLPQLIPLLPREFDAYHEPFAGSATLFFALGLNGKRVHLNDDNAAVAALYRVIQYQAQELKDMLAAMAAEYGAALAADGRKGGKAYFDVVKAKYNERPPDTERAAMLVFLMHMSFCSLYSENPQGDAQVYYGPTRGKADTRFYLPAKIDRAAAYFSANDVRASCGDFEQVLQDAAAGDFVFMDPPYMGGTFTRYSAGDFTESDHLRVHAAVEELYPPGMQSPPHQCQHPTSPRTVSQLHTGPADPPPHAPPHALPRPGAPRAGHHELPSMTPRTCGPRCSSSEPPSRCPACGRRSAS